ncbi:MAG TPA: lysylphosphatidylglycerol synthase transmembrane domain-containing protein [Solirubrobacteraceae bacterium]|nr:lysylphosphatidylglycerol synthase transmembrane domain-containing protein [Solirubrobacteraceae bacterium]
MSESSDGIPGTGSGRHRRRALALQAVIFAVLAGAVALAIAGLVPGSGQRLRHAAVAWILVEVVLELIACLAYAGLFHGVFSGDRDRLPYTRSAQIAIGELGAFVVVPTGAGGPALRIWALLRSGMSFRTQMVRSVVHAAIFNLPYLLAALFLGTSVALGVGPGHAPLAVALAPLGVVLVTVLIAAAAALFARRLSGEPKGRWQKIGRDVIEAIPDGVREVPRALRRPALLLAATAYWAGDCGVLFVAFHAAHGSAPVGVVVLAYMLGQLGNALPLPGGVGGVEPIMLGVLTASGVDLGLGAAAIVLYRFVSLGIQAVAGAIAVAMLTAALGRSAPDPESRAATR